MRTEKNTQGRQGQKYIHFQNNGIAVCYLEIWPTKIYVKTGKPTDPACLSWVYTADEMQQARATAEEFFNNYTNI